MKVLYIHPAATFGGASKSLIEIFSNLKQHGVKAWVICPKGTASSAFLAAGMNAIETVGLTQFDNTYYSHYRKLRWIILIRELFFLPFSIMALIRAKNMRVKFDLIHVNEVTLLPTACIAKYLFGLPIVIHVRSIQRKDNQLINKIYYKVLNMVADSIICIDEMVRASMPPAIDAIVIHNGINLRADLIPANKKISEPLIVALVGVLLRLKGVYEFIEAARIISLKKDAPKIKFILVGSNSRKTNFFTSWLYKKLNFSEDVYANVEKFILLNNLSDYIELRGQVDDIRLFYPEIDILCFPSYLNACGRPVFEAAFYGVPSIVALDNPCKDTFVDGFTGIAINKPDPKLLADAILRLAEDDLFRITLGKQAKDHAYKFFDIKKNAIKVLDKYTNILAKR
jgi:glycosyltransferase involved in cell wall biosynthesis